MEEKVIVFIRDYDILGLDEKAHALSYEPVMDFLSSIQLKSRNNSVAKYLRELYPFS